MEIWQIESCDGVGFLTCLSRSTLFYKIDDNDITLLLIYVDDMIGTDSNTSVIE